MSIGKGAYASVNSVVTAAQAYAAKVAAAKAAEAAYLAKLATVAKLNAAGVAGAGSAASTGSVVGAGSAAGVHSGLSVAAAVATPIAVTAAAVLVTYAAARLAGGATERLADLAEEIERDRSRNLRDEEAQRLWERAVAGVLSRNARIAALRDSLGPGDPDLPLPAARAIGGSTVEALLDWCRTADQILGEAVATLFRARRAAARAKLREHEDDEAMAEVNRFEEQIWPGPDASADETRQAARNGGTKGTEEIEDKVARELRELRQDVGARNLAEVLRIAGVARGADASMARTWLLELQDQVRQANGAAAEAERAAVYLEVLDGPDGGPRRLAERLRAVRAGRAPLDQALLEEAEQHLAEVRRSRERRHLMEIVSGTLDGLGMDVDVTVTGGLRVQGPRWGGHFVDLEVDARNHVAATLRTVTGEAPAPAQVERWRAQAATLSDHLEGIDLHLVETTAEPVDPRSAGDVQARPGPDDADADADADADLDDEATHELRARRNP
ncbi:hypothetical protein GCM10009677_02110 [Sphaerisporangium rubeum]|uniref:Uncharacterized protein n=1 Tax=Sphaerisporangium rubeum TaxID=321317 RepID=A0A7X0M6E1_9ACTN|nr:hypothetical protein [Sphaerisporangium rubeum]MBB6473162.1 hypothetical protein [Sphaerisporangium rubeum]